MDTPIGLTVALNLNGKMDFYLDIGLTTLDISKTKNICLNWLAPVFSPETGSELVLPEVLRVFDRYPICKAKNGQNKHSKIFFGYDEDL